MKAFMKKNLYTTQLAFLKQLFFGSGLIGLSLVLRLQHVNIF